MFNTNPVTDSVSFIPNMPDFKSMSPEEITHYRAKMHIKFDILRENWPRLNVGMPQGDEDPEKLYKTYYAWIKYVHLNSSSGQFKVYLIIFFALIELALVKGLKIGLARGLCSFQIKLMNKYDTVMLELGEKYLFGFGNGWPAEVRLLMFSVVYTGIFIGIKLLGKYLMGGDSELIEGVAVSFLNSGSSSAISGDPEDEIPNAPAQDSGMNIGGIDIGSMISGLTGMATGKEDKPQPKKKKPRGPVFSD